MVLDGPAKELRVLFAKKRGAHPAAPANARELNQRSVKYMDLVIIIVARNMVIFEPVYGATVSEAAFCILLVFFGGGAWSPFGQI